VLDPFRVEIGENLGAEDPLAGLTTELAALVRSKGDSFGVLAESASILALAQVGDRSPSAARADLAETAWTVIQETVQLFKPNTAEALSVLLGIDEDAERLGPYDRQVLAAGIYGVSSEHMRKVVWERLIRDFSHRLFADDYSMRMKEKQEATQASIALSIGDAAECPHRRLIKVARRLTAANRQVEVLREELLSPEPDPVAMENFVYQLLWTWARLDIKAKAIRSNRRRADAIPDQNRQAFIDSLLKVKEHFPLAEMEASWLRTTYRNSSSHELYAFSLSLQESEHRLEAITVRLISWLSCAMADHDDCDCELHIWIASARQTIGILSDQGLLSNERGITSTEDRRAIQPTDKQAEIRAPDEEAGQGQLKALLPPPDSDQKT
jgi:hypothetical protein